MKKLFSILIVTLMLISPFAMCANAESVAEQAIDTSNTTSESKLTADLQEHLASIEDDEYVPIYIWLNDYGEDMLYEVLSKRVGKIVTADTEEAYIQDRIKIKEGLLEKGLEALAKTDEYKLQAMSTGSVDIKNLTGSTFKTQASLSNIMTDDEIDKCINSDMTSKEIITLSERNQFLSDYRQSRKAVNTAVNTTFYNSLNLDECRNVYLDPLLCRVTMECKKSYVDDIETLSIVNQVGGYEEVEFVEEEIEASETSRSSMLQEYHMYLQNTVDGTTYTGAGIRVGVLEVNYFDPNAPHLDEKTITTYSETPTNAIKEHGTKVMSILAGEPLVINGHTYQGIAPNVSLYFAGGGTTEAKLNWFIVTQNCNIINMSLGNSLIIDGKYSDEEKRIDNLIVQYGVSIVKSAGNEGDGTGYITRPGMSYNAIVVGNLDTTSSINGKYEMRHTSSYKEFQTENSNGTTRRILTNKPDIAAIGTEVIMAISDTQFGSLGTGTSFAAPQVAGAVALMMQANTNLIGKPDTVKAILLNSADEEAISPESNDGVEANGIITEEPTIYNTSKIQSSTGTLREKSGAGLLNIEAAIRMANSNLYYDFTMGETSSTVDTETYYFNAGTTIEFGLAYEKATDDILTEFNINDLDIRILDSNDDIVFASADYINNVEMFKCTFAASGEYKFNIFCWHAEEPINATFILSCSCNDKVLSHGSYQVTQHTVSCDTTNGCGFICYEKHRVASVTKSFGYGSTATFNVYYLFEKNNENNRNFDYYQISIDNLLSTQGTFWEVRGAGLTTTTTSTGEIRTHGFEAVIELPGGNPVFPTTSVIIRIDYFDKTILLE